MQKVLLIGNLGNDARVVPGKTNDFISFSVACNRNKEGENIVQWYNCTYNAKSFKIAEYLKKGTQVFIEGFPVPEVYEGKASIKIFVNEIHLCGSKNSE